MNKTTRFGIFAVAIVVLVAASSDALAYYDPQQGRFIARDPIGYDGGDANLYQYVHSNPEVFVDPSGMAGEIACAASPITVDSKELYKWGYDERLGAPRKFREYEITWFRNAAWNWEYVEQTTDFKVDLITANHVTINIAAPNQPRGAGSFPAANVRWSTRQFVIPNQSLMGPIVRANKIDNYVCRKTVYVKQMCTVTRGYFSPTTGNEARYVKVHLKGATLEPGLMLGQRTLKCDTSEAEHRLDVRINALNQQSHNMCLNKISFAGDQLLDAEDSLLENVPKTASPDNRSFLSTVKYKKGDEYPVQVFDAYRR